MLTPIESFYALGKTDMKNNNRKDIFQKVDTRSTEDFYTSNCEVKSEDTDTHWACQCQDCVFKQAEESF